MRVLIIGLGVQGKKRAAIAGTDVVGTVDPVHDTATFKDVFSAPLESFDAGFVCTPDAVKAEILTYLISNGKHVLVEKPLLNDKENSLQKLLNLARTHRVTVYTAYNHRFEPHIATAHRVIRGETLGTIYSLSMFYGNGTARDVRNSVWRDQGMGVLSDLGSHLLDTTEFLLGTPLPSFGSVDLCRFENVATDHAFFSTVNIQPKISLEATLLSWRNTFRLELIASDGSLHISGLCKWGPSTISIRKRVLPSGRPTEEVETIECADPTWAAEYNHFKAICESGYTNLETDIRISKTLNEIFSESHK